MDSVPPLLLLLFVPFSSKFAKGWSPGTALGLGSRLSAPWKVSWVAHQCSFWSPGERSIGLLFGWERRVLGGFSRVCLATPSGHVPNELMPLAVRCNGQRLRKRWRGRAFCCKWGTCGCLSVAALWGFQPWWSGNSIDETVFLVGGAGRRRWLDFFSVFLWLACSIVAPLLIHSGGRLVTGDLAGVNWVLLFWFNLCVCQ